MGELDLIQQREDMWLSVEPSVTQLRKQCIALSQQIEETKNDYLQLGTLPERNSAARHSEELDFRDTQEEQG